MSKATINSLQLLRASFAQKIAACKCPETDVRINRVYLPLYEISAVLLLAVQEAKKTDYRDSLENRAALSLVKKRIAEIRLAAQRTYHVPGYKHYAKITGLAETEHEIVALQEIANDLLA